MIVSMIQLIGSAPRVRGTHVHQHLARVLHRFSPAGAGNTPASRNRPGPIAVQPRGCGEHRAGMHRRRCAGGSAPRVRGTRVSPGGASSSQRFSPAGAGNTAPSPPASRHTAVQPRGCGEHESIARSATLPTGSAPRVRGTRELHHQTMHDDRFSPAGAGNTHPVGSDSDRSPVQPRGCGEHEQMANWLEERGGSAPRVRGTHPSRVPHRRRPRFSPAGAGNTR